MQKKETVKRSANTSAPKARTARCSLCGRMIDSTKAFCVIKGPKKFFYCSKKEYEGGQAYVEKREKYESEIVDSVKAIVCTMDLPSGLLEPLLTEWLDFADILIINDFLHEKQEGLATAIANKAIDNTEGRVRYLSAIIKRQIIKYAESRAPERPAGEITESNSRMFAPRVQPRKNMRRSLEELENEYTAKS